MRGLWLFSVMTAEGFALHAVLRAPFVRHARANLPQFRKKLLPHAFFQDFHRPAFELFCRKADGPVNQLHVFLPEFLEKFVEFGKRLGHDVSVAMRILGIVDFFDRQPVPV